jgi:RNA polymerase sigma factor (sigma-70 family)
MAGQLLQAPNAVIPATAVKPAGVVNRVGDTPHPGNRWFERMLLDNMTTVRQVVAVVAKRHGMSWEEAEDLTSLAYLKIISDDYAVLRRFRGDSSLRTYLTVVIQRVYVDHRNAQFGKWRPTAKAQRHGAIGVLFERLIVRDGLTFDEACTTLESRGSEDIGREALASIHVGACKHRRPQFTTDDELVTVATTERTPDHELIATEDSRFLAQATAALRDAVELLPARDRLIVALKFCKGMTVAEIARTLGIEQKPLYKRLPRLIKQLRRTLEANGIGGESVLAALESDGGERKNVRLMLGQASS